MGSNAETCTNMPGQRFEPHFWGSEHDTVSRWRARGSGRPVAKRPVSFNINVGGLRAPLSQVTELLNVPAKSKQAPSKWAGGSHEALPAGEDGPQSKQESPATIDAELAVVSTHQEAWAATYLPQRAAPRQQHFRKGSGRTTRQRAFSLSLGLKLPPKPMISQQQLIEQPQEQQLGEQNTDQQEVQNNEQHEEQAVELSEELNPRQRQLQDQHEEPSGSIPACQVSRPAGGEEAALHNSRQVCSPVLSVLAAPPSMSQTHRTPSLQIMADKAITVSGSSIPFFRGGRTPIEGVPERLPSVSTANRSSSTASLSSFNCTPVEGVPERALHMKHATATSRAWRAPFYATPMEGVPEKCFIINRTPWLPKQQEQQQTTAAEIPQPLVASVAKPPSSAACTPFLHRVVDLDQHLASPSPMLPMQQAHGADNDATAPVAAAPYPCPLLVLAAPAPDSAPAPSPALPPGSPLTPAGSLNAGEPQQQAGLDIPLFCEAQCQTGLSLGVVVGCSRRSSPALNDEPGPSAPLADAGVATEQQLHTEDLQGSASNAVAAGNAPEEMEDDMPLDHHHDDFDGNEHEGHAVDRNAEHDGGHLAHDMDVDEAGPSQQVAATRHRKSSIYAVERQIMARGRKSLAGDGLTQDEAGQRRSTRTRSRPLEYWRNEHKTYAREHKTMPTVAAVHTRTPNPAWPLYNTGGKGKARSKARTKDTTHTQQ